MCLPAVLSLRKLFVQFQVSVSVVEYTDLLLNKEYSQNKIEEPKAMDELSTFS